MELGRLDGSARRVIEADGRVVAPGFVDNHFPGNGWRIRELAEGIHYTVVNGEVLLEKGTHAGSYPGRVLRNARYQAVQGGQP